MPEKPFVGFICVHNSCRSQIAEALANKYASDTFTAFSAGTYGGSSINAYAREVLRDLYDIDMSKQYSKSIADIPPLDIVVTMGCGVSCPHLACSHEEDWGLDDPSASKEQVIKATREIHARVLDLRARIKNNTL